MGLPRIAAVMALARPGAEQEQDPRPVVARHRVPLVRLELEQLLGAGVERLVARFDPHRSLQYEEERPLLDAVLAECLAGPSSISTARSAPSREWSTTGDRVPCGVSISWSTQWRTREPFPHLAEA